MKKIFYNLIILGLLINIYGCAGYKPIFSASNLEFKITDYSLTGDKIIGNKIYSKFYALSRSSNENVDTKNVYITIDASKEKSVTAKDSAGKDLGYKINISAIIKIKDITTGVEILNENLSFSSTYSAQEQFSETKKLENRTTENLIDKTYQDLLIKFSNKLLSK